MRLIRRGLPRSPTKFGSWTCTPVYSWCYPQWASGGLHPYLAKYLILLQSKTAVFRHLLFVPKPEYLDSAGADLVAGHEGAVGERGGPSIVWGIYVAIVRSNRLGDICSIPSFHYDVTLPFLSCNSETRNLLFRKNRSPSGQWGRGIDGEVQVLVQGASREVDPPILRFYGPQQAIHTLFKHLQAFMDPAVGWLKMAKEN